MNFKCALLLTWLVLGLPGMFYILSPQTNKQTNKYIYPAVLIPGYIYYQLNFSQSNENDLQPNQRLLLQNCSSICSFLQHVPCSSGPNCSQSDLCLKMEKLEKCKQFCVNTMWQPLEMKEVEIIDPEEVCFQQRK